jgi:hypothetical protein
MVMPMTTNHGSVPNHLSAKNPRRNPDMIEAKKLPPATQPSFTAWVTCWWVDGFLIDKTHNLRRL